MNFPNHIILNIFTTQQKNILILCLDKQTSRYVLLDVWGIWFLIY